MREQSWSDEVVVHGRILAMTDPNVQPGRQAQGPPWEMALSTLAEVVATGYDRPGGPMRQGR